MVSPSDKRTLYETNAGEKYWVTITSTHFDFLPTKVVLNSGETVNCSLPSSCKKRYLFCVATDGSGTRKIAILAKADWTADAFNVGRTIGFEEKEWVITQKIPEKIY